MSRYILFLLIFILNGFHLYSQQKGDKKEKGEKEDEKKQEAVFNTNVPSHDFDIISGRPENHSVTISVLSYKSAEAYIEFNNVNEKPLKTEKIELQKDLPKEIVLKDLKSNSKYIYYLFYKPIGNGNFIKSKSYYFQTQKSVNKPFIFTVSADSHLDQNSDPLIYKTSMTNVSTDSSDFHIDLGDTFMTDKYRENYKQALNQYIAQRFYFSLSACPLFLVQGNHDGESGQRLNATDDNMTVWSNLTRKMYFPNPQPDAFYSGNEIKEPFVGEPQDYYAWDWGNALFIVLDPFWYTPRSGSDNPWDRTLGKNQYLWLKSTLEKSKSRFKFVFIHNLAGGLDIKGKARGGSEAAVFFEWGGNNTDGSEGFQQHRPGWNMPIHQFLVKYKVSAVFHGHDHLFARQELDGILYQCLPQPGAIEYDNTRQAEEYGYTSGTILNGPGYLRINVSENQAAVDYVITSLTDNYKNKEVVYSYQINKN